MQLTVMEKILSWVRRAIFVDWFCHRLPLWSWANKLLNDLRSINPHCKMGRITVLSTLQDYGKAKMTLHR